MYQRLVSHNEDLRRLVEKGYAVGFDSNCLVVRDIPFLDDAGELKWGALVAKLEFIDREHVKQADHQVFFAGTPPHNLDGTPVRNLGGGPTRLPLLRSLAPADRQVTIEVGDDFVGSTIVALLITILLGEPQAGDDARSWADGVNQENRFLVVRRVYCSPVRATFHSSRVRPMWDTAQLRDPPSVGEPPETRSGMTVSLCTSGRAAWNE